MIVKVKAPDGWICEVDEREPGVFSPLQWRDGGSGVDDPSPGLQVYVFRSAEEAMMTAYRERVHRYGLKRYMKPPVRPDNVP